MRYSIRFKLFIVMSGIIAFFVLLSFAANKFLLVKFYNYYKTSDIIKSYEKIDSLNQGDSEDLHIELEKLENAKSMSVIILDKNLNVLYYSRQREGMDRRKLPNRDIEFRNLRESVVLKDRLPELAYHNPIIEKNLDKRLNTYFISLFSLLRDGNYLIINSPVAAIEESAKIANKFFLLVGIATIVLGTILIILISSRSTKPILVLNEIAKSMAKLDFSKKYPIKSKDEIADLGESINSLSEQLEKSILELQEANMKLREDIEKERRIDEMRKEFISNVSHELKTPIALIQGYAEGLRLNVNEDEENKNFYCDVITDESLKMNKLVKNLLDLSQIENKTTQLEKINFKISEIIEMVLKKNLIILKDKDANVITELDDTIVVNADFDKIEQVFVNYVNNAINHMDNEKIIRVSTSKSYTKVRISVFNSGKNVPIESVSKIWDSFYKVDKARTRDYGGTGLGLSVVKAIQILHNNLYGVINKENGVEFWFEVDIGDTL